MISLLSVHVLIHQDMDGELRWKDALSTKAENLPNKLIGVTGLAQQTHGQSAF